jgi:hypothetical protein
VADISAITVAAASVAPAFDFNFIVKSSMLIVKEQSAGHRPVT